MLSRNLIDESLAKLGLLKYFPARDASVAEVGRMLGEICPNDAAATKLVEAALNRFDVWPGPSALKELASEAAPRQDSPVGCCEVCSATGGYRRAFEVFERLPEGEHKRLIRCDEPRWSGVMAEAKRLAAQYPRPRFEVYDVLVPCRCPLGDQRADEMRARAQQQAV